MTITTILYQSVLKRSIDFLVAFIGCILLSPVFIVIFIVLLFKDQETPLFFQIRPGKNEELFRIVKFKTMNDKRDHSGVLLPDKERLTTVGKFLRKTSLDEIPQLINVLKGDMSLIGPRPLLPQYLQLYTKEQKKRHAVKPGITGWAQINGRTSISWEKKLAYDVWYVNNSSFALDLKIFLLTFIRIFRKEDIRKEEEMSVGRFTGTSKGI